jgi:hypothetical protein
VYIQSKVIRRRFSATFPNVYDDVEVIDSDAKIDWGRIKGTPTFSSGSASESAAALAFSVGVLCL